MAGDEDRRARAVLAEMLMRISQGPHAALSISESASAEEVRAAFLQLTKQFHPARFGRYAPDVLKMANEVFLGIKAAHDQLTKLLGSTGRPAPRSSQTPPVGVAGGTVRGTGLVPKPGFGRGTTDPLTRSTERGGTDPLTRGTEHGGTDPLNRGSDLIRRPSSPVMTTPSTGNPRAPSPPARPATPPATQPLPRSPTPAIGIPIQRASTPPAEGGKRPTPMGGVPTQPRPTSPAGTVRPITPATQRTASPGATITPPTIRYGAQSSSSSGSLPKQSTEEVEREHALSLLSSKDWTAARLAFHTLAAKNPQSRQYRALLCYARGRETQATGRADDAAMEFQRALQLDPELELAKVALRELGRKSRF